MDESGRSTKMICGALAAIIGCIVGAIVLSGKDSPQQAGAMPPALSDQQQIMREAMNMAREAQQMQRERMKMMREQMEMNEERLNTPGR